MCLTPKCSLIRCWDGDVLVRLRLGGTWRGGQCWIPSSFTYVGNCMHMLQTRTRPRPEFVGRCRFTYFTYLWSIRSSAVPVCTCWLHCSHHSEMYLFQDLASIKLIISEHILDARGSRQDTTSPVISLGFKLPDTVSLTSQHASHPASQSRRSFLQGEQPKAL